MSSELHPPACNMHAMIRMQCLCTALVKIFVTQRFAIFDWTYECLPEQLHDRECAGVAVH